MKERPYFEAFEDFLRNVNDMNIRAVSITALCEKGEDAHNVIGLWRCGPYEIMEMANVLQLRATELYRQAQKKTEDPEE